MKSVSLNILLRQNEAQWQRVTGAMDALLTLEQELGEARNEVSVLMRRIERRQIMVYPAMVAILTALEVG